MSSSDKSSRDPDSTDVQRADSELGWMCTAHAESEVLAVVETCVRRRQRWLTAAATLCLAGIATVGFVNRAIFHSDHTARAERATATVLAPPTRHLPDGSVIELREGAEVSIDYSGPLRRVILRRGEAHFQVAKNKERPFVVTAGEIEARALGTAFSVGLQSSGVEVLVEEGRVAVDRNVAAPSSANDHPALAVLEAGRLLVVSSADNSARSADEPLPIAIEKVTTTELAARLAWRIPRLEFSRTPLPEVVALMNEHAARPQPVHFVVGDDTLRDVKLSGFLRADNVDGLIELLATNFGIVAERRAGAEIILYRNAAR